MSRGTRGTSINSTLASSPSAWDDVDHNRNMWEKVAQKQFPVLRDSSADVIRQYGLLHTAGNGGADVALRTTLLIDPQGIEQWRRISENRP